MPTPTSHWGRSGLIALAALSMACGGGQRVWLPRDPEVREQLFGKGLLLKGGEYMAR